MRRGGPHAAPRSSPRPLRPASLLRSCHASCKQHYQAAGRALAEHGQGRARQPRLPAARPAPRSTQQRTGIALEQPIGAREACAGLAVGPAVGGSGSRHRSLQASLCHDQRSTPRCSNRTGRGRSLCRRCLAALAVAWQAVGRRCGMDATAAAGSFPALLHLPGYHQASAAAVSGQQGARRAKEADIRCVGYQSGRPGVGQYTASLQTGALQSPPVRTYVWPDWATDRAVFSDVSPTWPKRGRGKGAPTCWPSSSSARTWPSKLRCCSATAS